MSELILASTSPYRRAQLERLGLPFRVVAPVTNEATIRSTGRTPEEVALLRAIDKAVGISAQHAGATVIGSDQVVDLDGRLLGKPGTTEAAIAQLSALNGRAHRLISALAVSSNGTTTTHVDVTTLHMRRLTREEMARYVEADRPLDCAGSYKIESRGIALFERIETNDSSAIEGLPMIGLVTILRMLGFAVP